MSTETKEVRRELTYYLNDKKAIAMVFRHVRCKDKFKPFWDELIAQPDIGYTIGNRSLFHSERVYDFFKSHTETADTAVLLTAIIKARYIDA